MLASPYEQFLEAMLEAEVFARDEATGPCTHMRYAAFPQLRGWRILARPPRGRVSGRSSCTQLDWIAMHANVCFVGRVRPGKTDLAIASLLCWSATGD